MSKTPTRIYAVKRQSSGTTRLVRATSQAQALRHVALDEYDVDVASQDQLVNALGVGIAVETATTVEAASP